MVENIFLVLFLVWLPQAVYQSLTLTYWWQVKEYRLDRFLNFLMSFEGKKRLGVSFILIKLVTLLLTIKTSFSHIFLLFILTLVYLDFVFFRDLFSKTIRKPVLTERAKKVLFTSFLGFLVTFLTKNFILGELLTIFTPYIGILWTIPIVTRVKRMEIKKAKEVLEKVKPKVIGITGSYGKTTTKEFVAHLLSQRFKTAKTEGSENTEFGIARKAFKNVSKGTKFFVVEMGAYKKGEIKKLSSIVEPQVGIITGIEEQHLSLFGSLDNIKMAKFELIESLPKNGVAIFNLSNKFCRELARKAEKLGSLKVLGYYLKRQNDEIISADMFSEVISVSYKKIVFVVHYKNEVKKLSVNLPGVHFLENLTGAILTARYFGVSWDEIESGCETISLPRNTMEVYKMDSGCVVINDTYNSTPSAFESALEYLSYFKGKKRIVITSGIIELGEKSAIIHQRIGKKLAKFVDNVYLTNRDFYKSFEIGMGEKKKRLSLIDGFLKEKELRMLINNPSCVILLEGRVPAKIMQIFEKREYEE